METKNTESVTLVGAGGIGSVVTLLLAKWQPHRVTIWDPDVIKAENTTAQYWFGADVGEMKARAAASWLGSKGIDATGHTCRFSDDKCFDTVIVTAVDSMQDRRDVWEKVMKSGPRNALYLEGRLSRESPDFCQLFSIQLDNVRQRECYEEWLTHDAPPEALRRDRDMVPALFLLTGLMGIQLAAWERGERQLPWQMTHYGASMGLESTFIEDEVHDDTRTSV